MHFPDFFDPFLGPSWGQSQFRRACRPTLSSVSEVSRVVRLPRGNSSGFSIQRDPWDVSGVDSVSSLYLSLGPKTLPYHWGSGAETGIGRPGRLVSTCPTPHSGFPERRVARHCTTKVVWSMSSPVDISDSTSRVPCLGFNWDTPSFSVRLRDPFQTSVVRGDLSTVWT